MSLGYHKERGLQRLLHALPKLCRDEGEWRVGHEVKRLARPGAVVVHRPTRLLDQVPFVDDDDNAFLLLLDVARDVQILRGEAFRRVNDEHHDVRAVDGPHRAEDAEALNTLLNPAPPPNAGGVNERQWLAGPRQFGVEAVAGRSRDVTDNRALLAEQRVEQPALTNVWPPDDGDLRSLGLGLLFHLRQRLDDPVEQIPRSGAVVRRDRDRLAEPELVELDGCFAPFGIVRLVRGQKCWLVRTS